MVAYTPEQLDKFQQEIKLRSYDDRYVGADEEKDLLKIAISMSIDVDDALRIIADFGAHYGIVIERSVELSCKDMLRQFARNDGKIDKKEFADVTALYLERTSGRISEAEVHKRLKRLMQQNQWAAKEGGLFGSKWFSAIPS